MNMGECLESREAGDQENKPCADDVRYEGHEHDGDKARKRAAGCWNVSGCVGRIREPREVSVSW